MYSDFYTLFYTFFQEMMETRMVAGDFNFLINWFSSHNPLVECSSHSRPTIYHLRTALYVVRASR